LAVFHPEVLEKADVRSVPEALIIDRAPLRVWASHPKLAKRIPNDKHPSRRRKRDLCEIESVKTRLL
jgi:hypothetical protein